jgi:hypothetical protein
VYISWCAAPAAANDANNVVKWWLMKKGSIREERSMSPSSASMPLHPATVLAVPGEMLGTFPKVSGGFSETQKFLAGNVNLIAQLK